MANFGVELVLVAFAVFTSLGFIVTYLVAVYENHVTPDLPYISDTGGKAPESCVFSFICSVAAVLVLLIVYVRYKHLHQYHHNSGRLLRCLNPFALVLGVISAVGMIMVGSFQNDVIPAAHFVGAFLVFGGGCVYEWLQTGISHRVYHSSPTRHISSVVIIVRLLLCLISTIFFVIAIVAGLLAGKYRFINENDGGSFKWLPADGGFGLHVTSTAAEWAAAGTFMLYFLTFHTDFLRIRLEVAVRLRYQQFSGVSITESTPLTI